MTIQTRARDDLGDIRKRTAAGFAYEWRRFDRPPQELEDNFWGYFQFFTPESFRGKRVLEVGPGMGRHTYYLARLAREVVAADLGPAIEVTRKNTSEFDNVRYLRGDIHYLPFPPESFDFACAIGVLPCVPDPAAALHELVRQVKPGGCVHVYVYWALEHAPRWQHGLLRIVNWMRRFTVRFPYRVLDAFAWLAAAFGYTVFSLPYKYLSRWRLTKGFAQQLPLQRYAKDGFRICHNDQFDRFSAPIEHRHTREEVRSWFVREGLEDIKIAPHWGWIASGRKPIGRGPGVPVPRHD